MRLFNNSKKKQAGLLEGEHADGTISNTQPASDDNSNDASKAKSTGVGGSSSSVGQPINMDWDKIYVEIDNDANGTVGYSLSGSSSTLVSENNFESKSYTIMEDDDGDGNDDGSYPSTRSTPRLTNINSETVGSSRDDFTRGQSGSTDGDGDGDEDAILTGAHASFSLERLRLSLTDNSFLWSKFDEADTDKDTLIGISEFSNLTWSLGLELDDAYTYRAFLEIDQDADSKINFYEFKSWWIASQDGDETIITVSSRKIPNQIGV
ncbi:hypothetical protein FRACYDRAFT_246925 [Fragilariopsis cylindrus CCMP1102]|uniref:EF-hand domain-containing protein n=1 Tax=Fragilariopsis cylindrus CCMP1102 TaxID=635003 RepID=A0A1E7EWR2_9STRA|nr:hypothetical protein FRACYDRAFT_246925 [Fragilariopsis cylindrus CCMP1102]|eukprot:OEU10478.1 hypothetical protein FRACYDRAFT_246925 [Fragilariopsis cylindrus CCMP1102]